MHWNRYFKGVVFKKCDLPGMEVFLTGDKMYIEATRFQILSMCVCVLKR